MFTRRLVVVLQSYRPSCADTGAGSSRVGQQRHSLHGSWSPVLVEQACQALYTVGRAVRTCTCFEQGNEMQPWGVLL